MATFKDINLQVGARLQMAVQNGAKQLIYYTELIGYVDKDYLIIKTPVENGLSIQIQVGEQVTLRILSGVDVFTLTCHVKTIFRAPHHYMHLSFPTDIQSIALRGAIRAKVNLPVQVNGIAQAGVIADISVTGAAIIADSALGELNQEALISFDFPIKPTNQSAHIDTSVTIRSIQQLPSKKKDAPPRFSHGVLFHELELTNQVMLLNLVYESMNRLS
ncbi:flagellar brake protein [Methylobacter tundripaludum]|nr:flagellar brake protein [Methylobacter tundripaludum]